MSNLKKLLIGSELTPKQVAMLLGVSERKLLTWQGGKPIPLIHAERLSYLAEEIVNLGETLAARRNKLFDCSGGVSVFYKLLEETPKKTTLHPSIRESYRALGGV